MHAVQTAEAKCRAEGNERYATVLATGGIIENIYQRGQYALAFTAKKFIHLPGVNYLDRAQWEPLTDDQMRDFIIQAIEAADKHGYIAKEGEE
jgi:hypothetical protein